MNLEYKSCKLVDLDYFLELKELCLRWYIDIIYGWNIDYQTRRSIQEINMFSSTLKIIIRDNQKIGITNFYEENDELIVGLILLDPNFQNKGIGSFILNNYIKTAKEQNKTIKLQTYKHNPARNLYERLGFKKYKEDDTHVYLKINKNEKR